MPLRFRSQQRPIYEVAQQKFISQILPLPIPQDDLLVVVAQSKRHTPQVLHQFFHFAETYLGIRLGLDLLLSYRQLEHLFSQSLLLDLQCPILLDMVVQKLLIVLLLLLPSLLKFLMLASLLVEFF